MVLFECAKCGNIDNTATAGVGEERLKGEPMICRKCKTGKWHNHFKERKVTERHIIQGTMTYIMINGEQVDLACYWCSRQKAGMCDKAFSMIKEHGNCVQTDDPICSGCSKVEYTDDGFVCMEKCSWIDHVWTPKDIDDVFQAQEWCPFKRSDRDERRR